MNPNKTSTYNFDLPSSLIATSPLSPRDSSKLLIFNKKNQTIQEDIFRNIEKYLPKDISIFLNNTKVFKAKFNAIKLSGGKVEILINKPIKDNIFSIFVKGKVHIGSEIKADNLQIKIIKILEDGTREATFRINDKEIDFNTLINKLNEIGQTPLPPYMKKTASKQDEENYQSIFADKVGSVAAPTASFHFTKELFNKIKQNYDTRYLTLHIGAGTFKPITTENIDDHIMHSEYYEIDKKDEELIKSNKPILCIGTTSTRAIEYYVRNKKLISFNDLFLNPNNQPQRVNHLLTNFHLPKSTLIMLVSSFIGINQTLKLYDFAIKNKYRFYSYGDCMLII